MVLKHLSMGEVDISPGGSPQGGGGSKKESQSWPLWASPGVGVARCGRGRQVCKPAWTCRHPKGIGESALLERERQV